MFDLAGIGAALTSAKVILDLARNANDAQLAMKISSEVANLQGRLIDVQQQALTLQSDNQDLRDEIRRLKQAAEEEEQLVYQHGVFWKTSDALTLDEDENGNRIIGTHWDGPYCPLCKEVNKQAVHLKWFKHVAPKQPGNLIWMCEVHNVQYEAPTMQS
jgi:hypothetical protein